MLREVNPLKEYNRAKDEIIREDETPSLQVVINPKVEFICEWGSDHRGTNLPSIDEIAAILIIDGFSPRKL